MPNRSALAYHYKKLNNVNKVILFIDLNKFKSINDTYGHLFGDSLLKEVAKNIKSAVRLDDIVCRYGGDEFVIILPNILKEDNVVSICEKITKKFKQNLKIDEIEINTSLSIGYIFSLKKNTPLEEVIKKSDSNMYFAKQKGLPFYGSEC